MMKISYKTYKYEAILYVKELDDEWVTEICVEVVHKGKKYKEVYQLLRYKIAGRNESVNLEFFRGVLIRMICRKILLDTGKVCCEENLI